MVRRYSIVRLITTIGITLYVFIIIPFYGFFQFLLRNLTNKNFMSVQFQMNIKNVQSLIINSKKCLNSMLTLL